MDGHGPTLSNWRSRAEDALNLNLDGWEGPLDLLLTLARAQKVDLARRSRSSRWSSNISPTFPKRRALKLEIAADYLVMAAWLAYLKSCLLLPKDPEADPSAEETGAAAAAAAAAARRDARRRRAADGPRPASAATCSCAARPKGLRLVRKSAWQATPVRPVRRLWPGQGAHRSRRCTSSPSAPVMTLEDAHRAGRGAARHRRSTGPRSRRSCRRPATRSSAARRWPVELRRRARTGAAGAGRASRRTSRSADLLVRSAA